MIGEPASPRRIGKPSDGFSRQSSRVTITKAHRDTFQWVLLPDPSTSNPTNPGSDFVGWLRNGSGVYWIQGKMGCGKSTLMKYVTEQELTKRHLREWANGQVLHCPTYYFSKMGTSELQQSLQGLYRTLLATLIKYEKGLFRVAFPNWQISDSCHEPTAAVLRDALDNILAKSELACKYCFFIDGLDEYQETDDRLRSELAEDILELARAARLSAVKLVVSSCPEQCSSLGLHTVQPWSYTILQEATLLPTLMPKSDEKRSRLIS
jgi:hypothetical protein